MFGYVVVPFICSLLEKKDDAKLRKAFTNFEEMAKDADHKVTEVLIFTLLDNFLTESKKIADELKPCIDPETLKSSQILTDYMNIH